MLKNFVNLFIAGGEVHSRLGGTLQRNQ